MTTRLQFKIAESESEKRAALQIIEAVFVHELGHTGVKPDGFDELSLLITAAVRGKTIAALRFIPDSPAGLPIEEHLELSGLRQAGVKLGEVSRLACLKEFRNYLVVFRGLGYFKELAQATGVSHLVIESLIRTQSLYRSLGFTPFGEPFCDRSVASLENDLRPNSVAMLARVADLRAKMVV